MIADAFKDAKRFLTIISLMSILNSFLKRDLPFLPLVFPAFFLFAAKKEKTSFIDNAVESFLYFVRVISRHLNQNL